MLLRYAVIGTGAIGGYYGGRLALAGNEVHFLFNSDFEYVRDNGLRVDSVKGDFKLNSIRAYNNTADMPKCDVVLVCLKSTNNKILKDILSPILHESTVVILIQNGLGLESDLQKNFPNLKIAGGLAFICSSKIEQGHIAHFDEGRLNLGSFSCDDDLLLNQVKLDFQLSGVETQLLDLDKARWMKLVWNIPFNGMAVVLNTTTDKLIENAATEQLLREMMIEVIDAANSSGAGKYHISESYSDDIIRMTKSMVPYSPSMKLDYDNFRPLEIEYIYTRPINIALSVGAEMKKVSMLEKQLLFLEGLYVNKKK